MFQGVDGQRPQRHSGLGIEISPDHHQFNLRLIRQQVHDRKRVGDHLQRFSNQQASHLQSGCPAIQQHRFPRLDEIGHPPGNPLFLLSCLRNPIIKLGERLPDVGSPSARPANLTDSVKIFQITPYR